MNPWDIYQSRMESTGTTKRDTWLRRERRFLMSKLPDSLSFFTVNINETDKDVAIVNTDNLNEKFIYSFPGDNLDPGEVVKWMDNHWLITERDESSEVYTRAKMIQCNYLLKWIDSDHIIHEQWCIIEDGTKYLTGQYEDREFFVTRGDSRIGMIIGKNEHTTKFKRGCRFLIDDESSENMLAYELTKPFKLGGVFNGRGVFKFVLQEVNTTDDDNQEFGVADYYIHFPKDCCDGTPMDKIDPDNTVTDDGRKVWL